MARKRAARNLAESLSVSITFDEEDARQLKQFMVDEDVPNANTAVRMMVLGALRSDRKWWAVVRAQRKSLMYEFRRSLYVEFLKKLRDLQQGVADEIVLFDLKDPSYGHADQT